MHVQRRSGEVALEDVVACLPFESRRARDPEQEILVVGQLAPVGELLGARVADAVVEPRDLDLAVPALEAGQDLGEGVEGVCNQAAESARMEVDGGAGDLDLGVEVAAEASQHLEQSAVVDEDVIAPQLLGAALEQVRQHLSPALLLALDQEAEVKRRPAGGEGVLGGLQRRQVHALVIAGATGEDRAVPDRRLEGRRDPLLKRVGGLDVVVAVDRQERLAGSAQPVRPHRRVAPAVFVQGGVHAHRAELLEQPLGVAAAIGGVAAERADAGYRELLGKVGLGLRAPGAGELDGLIRHGTARPCSGA